LVFECAASGIFQRHELGQNGYHFSGILRGLFSNRFDLAGIRFDLIHDAFTAAPLNHRGDAGAAEELPGLSFLEIPTT